MCGKIKKLSYYTCSSSCFALCLFWMEVALRKPKSMLSPCVRFAIIAAGHWGCGEKLVDEKQDVVQDVLYSVPLREVFEGCWVFVCPR